MTLPSRSPSHLPCRRFTTYLTTLSLTLGFCGLAAAQTLKVTTGDDDFDGACNSHCSLRDAIYVANQAGVQVHIRLGAGDYSITRYSAPDANGYPEDEQAGLSGDFDVLGDIIITGAGRTTRIMGTSPDLTVEIPARPAHYRGRLFDVHPGGRLIMKNLDLLRGLALDEGGALKNRGDTVLRDVDLYRNGVLVPEGYGLLPQQQKLTGVGGAISNHGALILHRSYLVGNRNDAYDHSFTYGSALYNTGQLLMRDSAVASNEAAFAYQDYGGEALVNQGQADIARVWFSDNNSGQEGLIALANYRELKLSNSTFFLFEGIANWMGNATLIHVTSVGGVRNNGRMRVRNSLFVGAPELFDWDVPRDCFSSGPDADFQYLGLVTSTPDDGYSSCPADVYADYAQVYQNLLYPRDEGNAAAYPKGSIEWARALGEKGSYLRLRAGGVAIDASVGSCAGHDQLARPRPNDGNGDGVANCDLGAHEY
jgi:CSLREA domain-containing protein